MELHRSCTGVYPAANHHGTSFADTDDIVRTALGGTDLMGGHRGALLEYRGDLKHFAEGVGIPHYASKESPCMFCHCTKASAHNRNVTHEPRTPQQYQTACFQQQIQVAVTPAQAAELARVLKASKAPLGMAIRTAGNPAVKSLGLCPGDRLLSGGDLIHGHFGGDIQVHHPSDRLARLHFFRTSGKPLLKFVSKWMAVPFNM